MLCRFQIGIFSTNPWSNIFGVSLQRKKKIVFGYYRCVSLFYEHPVMALKVRVRATPTRLLLTFFSESVRLKHDQASSLAAASEAVRKEEVNKVSKDNSFSLKIQLVCAQKNLRLDPVNWEKKCHFRVSLELINILIYVIYTWYTIIDSKSWAKTGVPSSYHSWQKCRRIFEIFPIIWR